MKCIAKTKLLSSLRSHPIPVGIAPKQQCTSKQATVRTIDRLVLLPFTILDYRRTNLSRCATTPLRPCWGLEH